MDINIIYNKLIEKLKSSNNLNIIEDLERISAGAVTGGEGLTFTGRYLLDLKENAPSVFLLLEDDIIDYKKYCKRYGITFK